MSQIKDKLKINLKKKEKLNRTVTVRFTDSEWTVVNQWAEEFNTTPGGMLKEIFLIAIEKDGENE